MRGDASGARAVGGVTAALLLLTACASGSTAGEAAASTTPTTTSATTSATTNTSATPGSPAPVVTSGTRTLADGRQEMTDTRAGLQLVLPAGFVRVTSKQQLTELAKDGVAGSGGMADTAVELTAAIAFAKVTTFFAYEPRSAGTVVVRTVPSQGLAPQDTLEKSDIATRTTIGGLPALRVDEVTSFGGLESTMTDVIAVKDDQLLTLMLTINGENTDAAIRNVITSVRFLDRS